jgi:hypothetical protein
VCTVRIQYCYILYSRTLSIQAIPSTEDNTPRLYFVSGRSILFFLLSFQSWPGKSMGPRHWNLCPVTARTKDKDKDKPRTRPRSRPRSKQRQGQARTTVPIDAVHASQNAINIIDIQMPAVLDCTIFSALFPSALLRCPR